MINPSNEDHRQRLSRALDYSYQEICKFNRARAVTIEAYLGVSAETKDSLGSSYGSMRRYKDKLPQGNLLQMAGLNHQIALAYGEPRVMVKARTPENAGLAKRLGPALNRMAALLNLGDIHRNVAADSYFGYGIYKVAIGYLPEAARVATGLEVGPCIWRVGQNNFLYDITADSWDSVSYVGDMYTMPLEEAKRRFPGNEDRLSTFTETDRLDARTVLPRPSRMYSAEQDIWLCDIYFPGSRTVATWPVRADSFGTITEAPLVIREYTGHWSGVYQVLAHLYSPDELVPVAQAESVKSIHFLFQDLLRLLSDQARHAKYNPVYQQGNPGDMIRLWEADDRVPVGITNPNATALPPFIIPGPTPEQSNFLGVLNNLFKNFNPTIDDPLRAPTATQATLDKQETNAIVAEAKRKDWRALQLVYYKLGHLMLNTPKLRVPNAEPLLPGSNIMVDVTFDSEQPHATRIDDYDISIEPYSTIFRSPQEKIQQLTTSTEIISNAMMLAAQGAPINVEHVIDTLAEYQDLPELREWYEPADPLMQARRSNSERSVPRIGGGHYVRENVSTQNNAGALIENLNQQPSENGKVPRF